MSLTNYITAKELKLIGIKNQLPNRREGAHDSCPCEDDDNRDVNPIGEGRFWRLVSHVVEKHWEDEIQRDEANCSYNSINVSKEWKHCGENPTEYHVQRPEN